MTAPEVPGDGPLVLVVGAGPVGVTAAEGWLSSLVPIAVSAATVNR